MNEQKVMNEDQAREGYRASIQLISQDARSIWESFRSLLGTNAVLIGLAGAVLKIYPEYNKLALILGILGFLVCIAWFLITVRHFDHYKYCYGWARKYEEIALGSKEHIVQEGRKFAEGSTITVQGVDPVRMRWAGRLFRIEYLIYVVIATLVVVYVYILRASY